VSYPNILSFEARTASIFGGDSLEGPGFLSINGFSLGETGPLRLSSQTGEGVWNGAAYSSDFIWW
jgi:hypothetical protein